MTIRSEARLQQSLDEVTRLLDKHRVLETLAHRQEGPKRDLLEGLQHRQNLAELGKFVRPCTAQISPSCSRRCRRTIVVWFGSRRRRTGGRAFVEVTSVVREWLVEETPQDALVRLLLTLDPEDLGYVSDSIPHAILSVVSRELESADRQAYEESIQYEHFNGVHGTRQGAGDPAGRACC